METLRQKSPAHIQDSEGLNENQICCESTTCPCATGLPCHQKTRSNKDDDTSFRRALSFFRSKAVASPSMGAHSALFPTLQNDNLGATRPKSSRSSQNGGPIAPITAVGSSDVISAQAEISLESERNTAGTEAPKSRLKTINGMRIFSLDVEKDVTDRFTRVCLEIEPPLVELLINKGVEFRPLGLQLLVLGVDEQHAKPWIVVLCSKLAKKRVEHFFRQSYAQNVCRGSDPSQLGFEVVVVSRPLKTTASESTTQVYIEKNTSAYPLHIRVTDSSIAGFATVGGFISVVEAHGGSCVYGMTVAHVLPLSHTPLGSLSSWRSERSGGSPGCSQMDSSSDMGSDSGASDISFRDSIESEETAVFNDREWSSLGSVMPASYSGRACDHDWALIEVDAHRLKPSSITSTRCYTAARPAKNQEALLYSNPARRCNIIALPARAILPFGKRFVDVHVVQLSEEEELPTGCSGSWVVDSTAAEAVAAYGVLVAHDPFGSLWTVPMVDVIKSVREELNAARISLLSSHAALAGFERRRSEDTESASSIEPFEETTQDTTPPSSPTLTQTTVVPADISDAVVSLGKLKVNADKPEPPANRPELPQRTSIIPEPNHETQSLDVGETLPRRNETFDWGSGGGGGGGCYVFAASAPDRKSQHYRWICCSCGGDNSVDLDAGCATCCNHWRC